MVVRKIVAGLAAVALAATPVMASAAQPLSLANSPELRAGAALSEANEMDGRIDTVWLIVGAVVIYLGIAAIADWWPFDDDDPDSP